MEELQGSSTMAAGSRLGRQFSSCGGSLEAAPAARLHGHMRRLGTTRNKWRNNGDDDHGSGGLRGCARVIAGRGKVAMTAGQNIAPLPKQWGTMGMTRSAVLFTSGRPGPSVGSCPKEWVKAQMTQDQPPRSGARGWPLDQKAPPACVVRLSIVAIDARYSFPAGLPLVFHNRRRFPV